MVSWPTRETQPRPVAVSQRSAAQEPAIPEAAPRIQFTFTSVELRDEAGTRWLTMDYVEQVRGQCERFFRYEANIPGFKAQTRMESYLSDAKGGFEPILYQRVLWKIPPNLPETEAIALRDLVAKQWLRKSETIEIDDRRVLLKVLVPGGGSLVTEIGVKAKLPPQHEGP